MCLGNSSIFLFSLLHYTKFCKLPALRNSQHHLFFFFIYAASSTVWYVTVLPIVIYIRNHSKNYNILFPECDIGNILLSFYKFINSGEKKQSRVSN